MMYWGVFVLAVLTASGPVQSVEYGSASGQLTCLYCDSFTSLEDCDENIETQECEPSETRCIVFKQEDESFKHFARRCMAEDMAQYLASGCTNNDYCQFGSCQTSECYASFEN